MGCWLGLFLVGVRKDSCGWRCADGELSALYHPTIEIGYGIEFGLPGLFPVGLAQAAGSTNWPEVLFLKSESEARAAKVCVVCSLIFLDSGTRVLILGNEGLWPHEDAQSAARRDPQRQGS